LIYLRHLIYRFVVSKVSMSSTSSFTLTQELIFGTYQKKLTKFNRSCINFLCDKRRHGHDDDRPEGQPSLLRTESLGPPQDLFLQAAAYPTNAITQSSFLFLLQTVTTVIRATVPNPGSCCNSCHPFQHQPVLCQKTTTSALRKIRLSVTLNSI
jgi:hypothetical protein